MTRLRVRENGTVKKRRDSKHAKDVLDEAQAFFKLKILAMMALFAQQQDIDPTPYMVCALINGVIIEDIQRDRRSQVPNFPKCQSRHFYNVLPLSSTRNAQITS